MLLTKKSSKKRLIFSRDIGNIYIYIYLFCLVILLIFFLCFFHISICSNHFGTAEDPVKVLEMSYENLCNSL